MKILFTGLYYTCSVNGAESAMNNLINLPKNKSIKKLVLSILFLLRYADNEIEDLYVRIDNIATYDMILVNQSEITSLRICTSGYNPSFCTPIIGVSPDPNDNNRLVIRINKDTVPAIRNLPEDIFKEDFS